MPAWKKDEWRPFLDKYKLLHTYPAGRYALFIVPDPLAEGGRDAVGPTRFPVNIWYAGAGDDEAQPLESSTDIHASTSGREHFDAKYAIPEDVVD